MATINSHYLGQLRTESTHIQSNNIITTDAPLDNNGLGQAFSPTDLVASALGSCMMTIMGIMANRENITLDSTSWEVTKIMQTSPRKIAEIQITFSIRSTGITEEQKNRLKNAALTCPVSLSLHPDIHQNITFNFI
jgi:putative redox protein